MTTQQYQMFNQNVQGYNYPFVYQQYYPNYMSQNQQYNMLNVQQQMMNYQYQPNQHVQQLYWTKLPNGEYTCQLNINPNETYVQKDK